MTRLVCLLAVLEFLEMIFSCLTEVANSARSCYPGKFFPFSLFLSARPVWYSSALSTEVLGGLPAASEGRGVQSGSDQS